MTGTIETSLSAIKGSATERTDFPAPVGDIRLADRFTENRWRSINQRIAFERYGPSLKSLFQARAA